jgi:hypothetical protein
MTADQNYSDVQCSCRGNEVYFSIMVKSVLSLTIASSRIGVSTLKLKRPFWQTRFGDAILVVVSFVVPFVVIFGVIVLLCFLIEN